MVDESTFEGTEPSYEAPAVETAASAPGGGFRAFYATTVGKVVVIGGALVLLGAVLAIVAVVVLGFLGLGVVEQAVQEGVVQRGPSSTPATATQAQASVDETRIPGPVPNSEVFTFRDIFEPLLRTEPLPSMTESPTIDPQPNTLYVIDVVSIDGIRHVVLLWNNERYTLPVGGRIENTPWIVGEIAGDSAVMIYGDSRVTLFVGQGIVAK